MKEQNYFYGLDPIRFFAAFIVAIFHLGFWASLPGSTPNKALQSVVDYSAISDFAWSGWVGVEVFFVLSGFVIAGSANTSTSIEFLKGRALRLYPAVWICASITFIALIIGGQASIESLLPKYLHTLALIPNTPTLGWIDGVYWTLQHEIAFYGLVLVTVAFRRHISISHLASALTIFSCFYISLSILRTNGIHSFGILQLIEKHHYTFLTALQFRFGCLFAAGVWLWMLATGRMNTWRYIALVFALLGGIGEVYIHTNEFISGTPALAEKNKWLPMIIWCASVFLIFITTKRTDKFTPKRKQIRDTLRCLGIMTYPLYLLHDIVGASFMRAMINLGVNQWISLISALIIVSLISWIVCMKFEPAIRRGLSSLLNRTQTKNKEYYS